MCGLEVEADDRATDRGGDDRAARRDRDVRDPKVPGTGQGRCARAGSVRREERASRCPLTERGSDEEPADDEVCLVSRGRLAGAATLAPQLTSVSAATPSVVRRVGRRVFTVSSPLLGA